MSADLVSYRWVGSWRPAATQCRCRATRIRRRSNAISKWTKCCPGAATKRARFAARIRKKYAVRYTAMFGSIAATAARRNATRVRIRTMKSTSAPSSVRRPTRIARRITAAGKNASKNAFLAPLNGSARCPAVTRPSSNAICTTAKSSVGKIGQK